MKVPKKKWDRTYQDIFPNADLGLFSKSNKTEGTKVYGVDFHDLWIKQQQAAKSLDSFHKASGLNGGHIIAHESGRRLRRRLARKMGKVLGK